MQIYPAIDLLDGRCVRLYQGDYAQATEYGDDPLRQAGAFVSEGAEWIHVVDLDAARSGSPSNHAIVARIASWSGVRVQAGGGVRSLEVASSLVEAGVARVVIGTAAVEDPGLVANLVERGIPVAVGLDVRGREVAVRGWERGTGLDLLEVLKRWERSGVEAAIVTQISRDGTLQGPDLEGLGWVLQHSQIDVIASGGVASIEDLRRLRELEAGGRQLAGVIVGRALYEGAFTLREAIASVQ